MAEAEQLFEQIVKIAILFIELAGIIIIVISMVRGFIGYIKHRDNTRIDLAQGIMLGLEFKIGSEVLRSVIVSGWNELGTLAAVILLRSLLTFLLHWEIDVEEKRQAEKLRLRCEMEAACPSVQPPKTSPGASQP
ncbi:MAG TPA: DUF1622 domain-containing protein [Candidatus Limiplasma sp.]|nr:DUF1622 domain-containing protein [Candidatus Limiplasma sp.]HPS81685.1 DUF1622 domain-containing protein [Candidatus Limiplasma sp.]